MNKKTATQTRPTTDADVLSAFRDDETWLSRKAICERVGRKKTPSLIARINRLADEGHLTVALVSLPNGAEMYVYKRTFSETDIPF